jgi:arginase
MEFAKLPTSLENRDPISKLNPHLYKMSIPLVVIQNAKGQPNQGVILQRSQVEDLIFKYRENFEIKIIPSIPFRTPQFEMYYLANICFCKVSENDFTLFLGGDHYSSFATILGSLKTYDSNLRILWIDAHADIHSPETSPSGNMHGMPVRFLITHSFIDTPLLNPEQIMYVGLRSVETEEWDYIHKNNIQYITAVDFHASPEAAYQKIGEFVEAGILHISLDVDSLDPSIMYSTGTAEQNGLLLPHIQDIFHISKEKAKKVVAMDIMEYNPTIGSEEEKQISKDTMELLFKESVILTI